MATSFPPFLCLHILLLIFNLLAAGSSSSSSSSPIPTTLDGPSSPVTIALDPALRSTDSDDLPNHDSRLSKKVYGCNPEQIGIAQSSTPHGMWISWVTGDGVMGSEKRPTDCSEARSEVIYRAASSKHYGKAKGSSLTYSQIYPYANATNYVSGVIHHVLITGLKPSTTYYYSCGDSHTGAMSRLQAFRTLPQIQPNKFPKRIAFLGDPGLTYNTTSTLQHLQRNMPDLNIFVGDMSYADLYVTNGTGAACYKCAFHTPLHETYQPRWDFWGRYLEPIRSKIPTMVIEGNHKYEIQTNNQTFVAYKSRFAVPAGESGSNTKMYYSFTAGGVHFVMLGAYDDYSRTGAQYAWLEKDLSKVDRRVTPWLIAVFHAPWYTSYQSHYREVECMREYMEDLLYKYGVDAIFAGHVHAYERTNRIYNYEYNPCGPVHITIGDGGNREGMAIKHADEPGACPTDPASSSFIKYFPFKFCGFNFTSGPASGKYCWDRQPDWSAFRESSFGHGILEVIKPFQHQLV